MKREYSNLLSEIVGNLTVAEEHLTQIRARIAQLAQEDIYPAVPSEQWQTRPGVEGRYLYLIFRQGRHSSGTTGGYQGPGGRRKIYVGADPAKINKARRMIQNRRDYDELKRHERALERYIQDCRSSLESIRRHSACWPRCDAELLGPQSGAGEAHHGPKKA